VANLVTGNAADKKQVGKTWYQVRDEMTDEPKGYITVDGETRDMDEQTSKSVQDAFGQDLMVRDGEVLEELGGVCFDGVCTIAPGDPDHNQMVLRNLGALTGLRPSASGTDDEIGNETHE
jgi:coproporphyrinogen III oxidase